MERAVLELSFVDTVHRVVVKKAEEACSAVALTNSIEKKSTKSSELKVHSDKGSKVMPSPCPSGRTIMIADIATLTGNQEIKAKCKVVKVNEMSTGKKVEMGKS